MHTYFPGIHTHTLTKIKTCIQVFVAASSATAHHIVALSEITATAYNVFVSPSLGELTDIPRFTRGALLSLTPVAAVFCKLYVRHANTAKILHVIRGVFTNPVVFPIIFSLTWRTCTSWGAVTGVVIGQVLGVVAWLVVAQVQHGSVDMETLTSPEAALAGNAVSLLASPVIAVIVSFFTQGDMPFEWNDLRELHLKLGSSLDKSSSIDRRPSTGSSIAGRRSSSGSFRSQQRMDAGDRKTVVAFGAVALVSVLVVWPLLVLPIGVFDHHYYTFWICLCFMCALISLGVSVLFPMYDAYQHLMWVSAGKRTRSESSISYSNRNVFGEEEPTAHNMQKRKESEVLSEMYKKYLKAKRGDKRLCESGDSEIMGSSLDDQGSDRLDDQRQANNEPKEDLQRTTHLSKQCKEILAMSTLDALNDSAEIDDQSSDPSILLNSNSSFTVSYLRRACMWLCNNRDIRLARPYLTAWDVLRWNARSMTMLFVGCCSCIFSAVTAVIYVSSGFRLAALALALHSFSLLVSFTWLRFVNVYRRAKGIYVTYKLAYAQTHYCFHPPNSSLRKMNLNTYMQIAAIHTLKFTRACFEILSLNTLKLL